MKMELDGLKNIWNKQTTGDIEKISTEDIYKMIHAKSSTTVKWIFIISLIELGLGFVAGILSAYFDGYQEEIAHLKSIGIYEYIEIGSIIIYIVILVFIAVFFYQYREISVATDIKTLIKTIVNTRKVVRYYILFNLSTFALFSVILGMFEFVDSFKNQLILNGIENPEISLKTWLIAFIIIVVLVAMGTLLFWFIYKLIYIRLLKKLHKNHQELLELE